MMQLVRKWKVQYLRDNNPVLEFFISENYYGNLLRMIANIDPVGVIDQIHIVEFKIEPQQHEFDTNYEAAMEALRKRPGWPNSNVRDARDSQR